MYEAAVQDVGQQVDLFYKIYEEANGVSPKSLCEDFCGTFLISKEWVLRGPHQTAIAIDLSKEPLQYGKKIHRSSLSKEEQKRLTVVNNNVLTPLAKKCDVVAACNFSFYVFHQRKDLLRYFKRTLKGLSQGGVCILEMAGGQGFIDAPYEEERVVDYEKGKLAGKPWFHYTWQHESFEPLTRNGIYNIHFRFKDGSVTEQVFRYDWRVWTIPEVRDCFLEAGFSEVRIYWEIEGDDNGGESEYEWIEETDGDDYTWICYAVAVK